MPRPGVSTLAMESEPPVLWRMPPATQWRFCPLCRAELVARELDRAPRRACPACGFVYWEHPRPSAAAVVADADRRVLCVRRRYPPAAGGWCLPGGFAEPDETAEAAACREVWEETGIQVEAGPQLGVGGLFIAFVAAEPRGGSLQAGPDVLAAEWFPADTAPPLCFPSHREALRRWLELPRPPT